MYDVTVPVYSNEGVVCVLGKSVNCGLVLFHRDVRHLVLVSYLYSLFGVRITVRVYEGIRFDFLP